MGFKGVVFGAVLSACAVWASSAQGAVIMVDVGAVSAGSGWNALPSPADLANPTVVNDLKDTGGGSTGINISSAGWHAGSNTNATTAPSGAAAIFAGMSVNSSYGNTTLFSGSTNPTATVTLSNLNPSYTYDLVLFGSRMGVTDNRETEYAVVGGSSQTSYLNVAGNETQVVNVPGMAPDGNNEIVISMQPGPNNNNSYGFFYLTAMQITETAAVPEPASLGLLALGGLALLRRR